MKKEPWLLIDCPYMAWRAHYTTGSLSHKGRPTGVLYGFFHSLHNIQSFLSVSRVAFCFDGLTNLRKAVYPDYKGNRQSSDPMKEAMFYEVHQQIDGLKKWLPKLGFRNVFCQEGYEADDLIASLVKQYTEREFIILSSDKDLYQLLRPGVWIWNPVSQKSITVESFQEEWGISPDWWAWVKAIAGCKTDNIPGISGVREKTAVKYLLGKTSEKQTQKIGTLQYDMLAKNLPLVTIPLPGLAPMELRPDEVTAKKWRSFCEWKGMKSLTKLNWKGLLYG